MRPQIGALFSGVVLLFSVASHADPNDALARKAAEEHTVRGKAFYKRAIEKNDSALYEQAYLEYARAYAIVPTDDALWNLVVVETDTKRTLDGMRHLREYGRRTQIRQHTNSPNFGVFDQMWTDAFKKTGHIAVDASRGAAITVDDKELVGLAPLPDPIDVLPGKHVVEAKAGERTQRKDVEASAGATVPVTLDTTPPVVATATTTAVVPPPLPPPHPAPDNPPPPASYSSGRAVTTVALGVGAIAAGVVGAYFFVDAGNQADKASQLLKSDLGGSTGACVGATSTSCQQVHDMRQTHDADQTVGTVLVVGGGVLAVGAVAALVLWPKTTPSREHVRLVPAVSPTSAGFTVEGRF